MKGGFRFDDDKDEDLDDDFDGILQIFDQRTDYLSQTYVNKGTIKVTYAKTYTFVQPLYQPAIVF